VRNSDLIFLLTINNNSRSENLTHLTTKMAIINNSVENTLSNIAAASKFMNLDTLYICSIVIDDTFECEVLELEEPCKVIYMEIGIKFFMERMLDNPEHDF
jgi:hypothetical protein